jgi:hypothetical protein
MLVSACGDGGLPPGGSGLPPPVQVSVSPITATVAIGGQRQFSATVFGGDGTQTVMWTVSVSSGNPGMISTSGLYTAPQTMPGSPTVTVRATSGYDPSSYAEATVTLVPGATFGQFPVEFQVRTRVGWQANLAPATVGIPLPPGLESDVNRLKVQRMPGQIDVPYQLEVVSRWSDGSIRWVLCDLIADLSASGGVGRYQLTDGATAPPPATDLSVQDTAASVEVSTGRVQFTLSKTAFRLFESIRIDRDNNGQLDNECLNLSALKGIVALEGADEFTMDRSAPSRVVIEQAGPIRATILVEGTHRNQLNETSLDFICRITAWNGLPFIRIQYSFKNMHNHGVPAATPADAAAQLAHFREVDALLLDLPFDFGAANVSALLGGHPINVATGVLGPGEYAELVQGYNGNHDAADPENPQPPGYDPISGNGSAEPLTNTWPIDDAQHLEFQVSGKVSASGERAMGWVQLVGADLIVTGVLRDFWQMYPKSLRVQHDGLMRFGIWPEGAWPMQAFAGAMRTHDILLSLERGDSPNPGQATQRANQINDAPFGTPNPRHNRATGVFGDIGATDPTMTNTTAFQPIAQPTALAYMAAAQAHLSNILSDRGTGNGAAEGHEYGFWSWGNGKTFDPVLGWENHVWGMPGACLSWFAASGNPQMFRLGDDAARHFRDVIVLHSDIGLRFDYSEPGNPAVSGGKASQRGKTRHWPNNKQQHLGHFSFGDHHLDVFNGAFLAEHYLMTGERLSLDVLSAIFEYLQGTWKRFFDASHGGVDSTLDAPTPWLSNALMIAAAYQLANGLNDPQAQVMADYVWNVVRARQTATTPRDPGGRGFADSNGDFKAWQIGHMLEAMEYAAFRLEIPNAEDFILDAMEWLHGSAADVYLGGVSPPQFGAFAEFPGAGVDYGGPNLMIGAGYVGARRAVGGATWITRAQNLLDTQTQNIDLGTIGDEGVRHSTFAQFFRAGPLALGALMP